MQCINAKVNNEDEGDSVCCVSNVQHGGMGVRDTVKSIASPSHLEMGSKIQ